MTMTPGEGRICCGRVRDVIDPTPAQMRAVLESRRARIARDIDSARRRLARLEEDRDHIDEVLTRLAGDAAGPGPGPDGSGS